jgi:hypothetical protein
MNLSKREIVTATAAAIFSSSEVGQHSCVNFFSVVRDVLCKILIKSFDVWSLILRGSVNGKFQM